MSINLTSAANGVHNPYLAPNRVNNASAPKAEQTRVDEAQTRQVKLEPDPQQRRELIQRLETDGERRQFENDRQHVSYDLPNGPERQAIAAYRDVAQQPERQRLDSMLGLDLFA